MHTSLEAWTSRSFALDSIAAVAAVLVGRALLAHAGVGLLLALLLHDLVHQGRKLESKKWREI